MILVLSHDSYISTFDTLSFLVKAVFHFDETFSFLTCKVQSKAKKTTHMSGMKPSLSSHNICFNNQTNIINKTTTMTVKHTELQIFLVKFCPWTCVTVPFSLQLKLIITSNRHILILFFCVIALLLRYYLQHTHTFATPHCITIPDT